VALLAVDLPDLFPVVLLGADALGVLLRRGDVLDGRVDPDVEDEVVVLGGFAALNGRIVLTG